MSFTHTNKVRYQYVSGSVNVLKEVSKAETAGAEMNVSSGCVLLKPTETALTLENFEFATAAQAKSVYLRLDGYNGELFGGVGGVTSMADLVDGEPYVWSDNGGLNFPPGRTNPMVNATDMLKLVPAAGGDVGATGTLTVSVLYDPS